MSARSAVIFVPNDTAKTGLGTPMMLRRVMGAPLLGWLGASLRMSGIERFFLVCHGEYLEAAKACFPQTAAVSCAADQDAPDQLHVFLSTAEENEDDVLVITRPVVCIPAAAEEEITDAPTGVCTVQRTSLMNALDEKFSFMEFLAKNGTACGEQEGFFAVSAPDELADWQPVLKRIMLSALTDGGVEIWDWENCCVEPTVSVGAGTELLPGTILRGQTVVGENCRIGPNALLEDAVIADGASVNASQVYKSSVGEGTTVGPFAYIRPGCAVGAHVRVGDFVELKNSVIGDGTKISHLTYVGDSDVGERINFGCGTVTVNYDRAAKYRTVIEDDAFIGCNANLIAPVTVGKGAYIAAGSTITDNVPPQALGIARARQNIKKDWALKHKLKVNK